MLFCEYVLLLWTIALKCVGYLVVLSAIIYNKKKQ